MLGFGSHITDMEKLLKGDQPLYKTGIRKLYFMAPKPAAILHFIRQLGIPQESWITAYAFGGCVLGVYADYVWAKKSVFPLDCKTAKDLFSVEAVISEKFKAGTNSHCKEE